MAKTLKLGTRTKTVQLNAVDQGFLDGRSGPATAIHVVEHDGTRNTIRFLTKRAARQAAFLLVRDCRNVRCAFVMPEHK